MLVMKTSHCTSGVQYKMAERRLVQGHFTCKLLSTMKMTWKTRVSSVATLGIET